MTRKERMITVEKQRSMPSNATDFEVIDYMEMKPGISMLTYRYRTRYEEMLSTVTRWAVWANDHTLAGGVLHTDFDR